MFQRILVAVDNSEISRQAFSQALSLAKVLNARLMLIHVLSPLSTGYPEPVFPDANVVNLGLEPQILEVYKQRWETFEQQGLDLLRSCTAQATNAGISCEFTQPLGDPGHAICTLARTWEADLIMIGRHGRTGLGELIMGSVSNYVTHHAPCAVLTVPVQVKDAFESELEKD